MSQARDQKTISTRGKGWEDKTVFSYPGCLETAGDVQPCQRSLGSGKQLLLLSALIMQRPPPPPPGSILSTVSYTLTFTWALPSLCWWRAASPIPSSKRFLHITSFTFLPASGRGNTHGTHVPSDSRMKQAILPSPATLSRLLRVHK